MEKPLLSVDERLYVQARDYCRKLKPEARGTLYYVLLDWCDSHQEIRKSLEKKHDAYEVKYLDADGRAYAESFDMTNGDNPYTLARTRYGELLKMGMPLIELRRKLNPFSSGINRMSMVILHHEKEQN